MRIQDSERNKRIPLHGGILSLLTNDKIGSARINKKDVLSSASFLVE
jgi:hypothetical protein